MVAAPASQMPRWRTLPWRANSPIAHTVPWIDTVEVVEVDDIGFEPLKTAVAAPFGVFRPPIRGGRPIGCAQIAEFAGNHVLFAMALYRAGDQFLIAALAVGVRAVEKIDADL